MKKYLIRISIGAVLLGLAGVLYVQAMKTRPIFETDLSSEDLAKIKSMSPNLAVDKSGRRIYVVVDGKLKKHEDGSFVSWRISLGGEPVGHKKKQGDKRTPEGLYRYSNHPNSRYYGSLWIHYPNERDVQQSFVDGTLNETQRDMLLRQVQQGELINDDVIGGAVLIHGTNIKIPKTPIGLPKMTDVRHPRTLGCVGMSNVDIFALREGLETTSGTVLILP